MTGRAAEFSGHGAKKGMKAERFILNHWILCEIEDGIRAQGHLHGRPGMMEGCEILTSEIADWRPEGEYIVLKTSNSTYYCDLGECVSFYECAPLLEMIGDSRREDPDIKEEIYGAVRALAEEKKEEKRKNYRNVFLKEGVQIGSLFVWNGCDCPYLKRVVNWNGGDLEIEEQGIPESALTVSIQMTGNRSMRVQRGGDLYRASHGFLPGGAAGESIYVENEGKDSIRINMTGAGPVCVLPGQVVCIESGH